MSIMIFNTSPSDEMFEEIRKCSIEIWQTYDNTYGYVDEKVIYVNGLTNVGSNYMTMYQMFDIYNQEKLLRKLKAATRNRILLALK